MGLPVPSSVPVRRASSVEFLCVFRFDELTSTPTKYAPASESAVASCSNVWQPRAYDAPSDEHGTSVPQRSVSLCTQSASLNATMIGTRPRWKHPKPVDGVESGPSSQSRPGSIGCAHPRFGGVLQSPLG